MWYDLKYELAEIISTKLSDYKENFNKEGMSIPTWVDANNPKEKYTDEEVKELSKLWNNELDYMINSFKQILEYNSKQQTTSFNESHVQDGLDKFSKHFLSLWD